MRQKIVESWPVVATLMLVIFTSGLLYAQIDTNTRAIKSAQKYKSRVRHLEKDFSILTMKQENHVALLVIQQKNQVEWQNELMKTVKEFVKETKLNNDRQLTEMQDMKAEIMKNTYQMRSITGQRKADWE